MISNPCLYQRRYKLAKEFLDRSYPNVINYVVEIMYKDQIPAITDKNNPYHLQIFTDSAPLWHKENAINIGIRKLLPKEWKAVAWIDADIEFDNIHWAEDTLKILNSKSPIVCQLFSHALDLDYLENPMTIFQSFGYQHCLGKKHGGTGLEFWHPGFGWACNRTAYEKMGGLYEHSILGSGDHNMALSFINKGLKSVNDGVTKGYKDHIIAFQERSAGILLGYTPGVIRHYFHGQKKNRRYVDRWKILVTYLYDPSHLTYNSDGLLIPTERCNPDLLKNIMQYFRERNEDEII
jgi:hypothetical protein